RVLRPRPRPDLVEHGRQPAHPDRRPDRAPDRARPGLGARPRLRGALPRLQGMSAAPAADDAFRTGAARVSIEPPLGLPMIGFVPRPEPANASDGMLEATAAAFERGSTRALVIGVDTLGIQAPEVDALRRRIADATGADPSAVLLNWN